MWLIHGKRSNTNDNSDLFHSEAKHDAEVPFYFEKLPRRKSPGYVDAPETRCAHSVVSQTGTDPPTAESRLLVTKFSLYVTSACVELVALFDSLPRKDMLRMNPQAVAQEGSAETQPS